MPSLELYLLGDFRILLDGQPLTGFRSDKARALLAYLAVENGRQHDRAILATLLWGEHPDDAARASLRTTLSNLHQMLDFLVCDAPDEAGLSFTRKGVQFDPPSPPEYWCDLTEFDALIAPPRAQTHIQADGACSAAWITRLTHVVELYQGDFLSGFSMPDALDFETWAMFQRETRHRQVLEALEDLITHYHTLGEYTRMAHYVRQQLALEPWLEAGHRNLMRALALTGQRDAALVQYGICCRVLQEELEITPDAETSTLYTQIAQGAFGYEAAGRGAQPQNPYKGLRAFDSRDAGNFFGREALVARVLERLGLPVSGDQPPAEQDIADDETPAWVAHFVALIGPSGSGKSSVVQAGVIPTVYRASRVAGVPWHIAVMRPGTDPLASLAKALSGVFDNVTAEILAPQLHTDETALAQLLETYLPAGEILLLIIDQAEEFYTLTTAQSALDQVSALLLTALQQPASRMRQITVLRADYYGLPLADPVWGRMFQMRREITLPLSPQELRQAIVGPAQRAGVTVETALIATLIADVGRASGALPLLQYTLTELYEHRQDTTLTLAAYRDLGGLAGALVNRAEQIYADLTPEAQEATHQLFLRLVVLDPENVDAQSLPVTRRRVSLDSVLALPPSVPPGGGEVKGGTMAAVIETFCRYRMLTLDCAPDRAPTVEIAHEALLTAWPRLREWVTVAREDLFREHRLATQVTAWEQAGREPSFVLHGQALGQVEAWTSTTNLSLTQAERDYIQASQQAHDVRLAQASAQQAREAALARRVQSLYLTTSAQLALQQHNTDLALTLALHANQIPDPPPQAQLMLSEAAYTPSARCVFTGHQGAVESVAFSPDGLTALSGSADRSLILWDIETGDILRRFTGHNDVVHSVAFLPDGKGATSEWHAISASEDGTLIVWDIESGQIVRRLAGHTGAVWDVAVHPNGRHVLSASADHTLRLWDINTGQTLRQFTGHQGAVYCASLTPDGRRALSGSADHSLILWDLETGNIIRHLGGQSSMYVHEYETLTPNITGHHGTVWDVVIDPTGRFALSISEDMFSILWDLKDGTLVREYQTLRASLFSAAFIAGTQLVALGTMDSCIALLNPYFGTIATEFLGHQGRVLALATSPDNRTLLSGAADGTLRLWDLSGGAELRQLYLKNTGTSLALSPDGKLGLIAHWTGEISLWDYESGQVIRRLTGHTEMPFAGVKFSRDGCIAISGSGDIFGIAQDNTLRVWDVATGQELLCFAEHTDKLWDIDLSPDGRFAISGSHDGTVRVWDISSAPVLTEVEGLNTSIAASLETGRSQGRILADFAPQAARSVAINPDGRSVLVGLAKGKSATPGYDLHLIDIETGANRHNTAPAAFAGHTDAVQDVVFSPDGRWALSGGHDKLVILWDVESGDEIRRFVGHAGAASIVAFVPGHEPTGDKITGCIALSAGVDNVIILWDIESGTALRRYQGHQGGITGITFNLQTHTLLTTAADDSVREWRLDLENEALLDWIQSNRHITPLTDEQRQQYNIQSPPD